MYDRLATFRAGKAFCLCVGQHTSVYQLFQEVNAAMFHDEERERLLGGTVGVVEGIVLILDQLHVTGDDLGAFLGRGVDRQLLALPVLGKMEVLGGDKAGSLRDKCLCVFGLSK